MNEPIIYIDRKTGRHETEKVFGGKPLAFLYGNGLFSRTIGRLLVYSLVRTSFFARLYGFWQKLPWSRHKIGPFIKKYHVDPSEFVLKIDEFQSFNDFFIRKLKPESRPVATGDHVAVIPADGRYYFYEDIAEATGFIVKGQKFDLVSLLQNESLARKYEKGSMVLARLCPTDYHRFHFPFQCTPTTSKYINGWLYSVNPIAVKRNIAIFTENKRTVAKLQSPEFGEVLFLEIGATNVGSIKQTYHPSTFQRKGDEKGYFEFGGSALVILFEPDRITFDRDLLDATAQGLEIYCQMGQPMGIAKKS